MASKPIRIQIIGDSSQLKKPLKQTTKRLEGFGKSVAKLGITSAAAFGATAVALGTQGGAAVAEDGVGGDGEAGGAGVGQRSVGPDA